MEAASISSGYLWWLFALANAVNLVVAAMFIARLWRPAAADRFGAWSIALGIPAAALSAMGIVNNEPPLAWVVATGWALFALLAWLVDHIVRLEFRQPRRLGILIPFLVLFYVPLLGMAILQLANGVVPWAITSVTFLTAFALSLWSVRQLGY